MNGVGPSSIRLQMASIGRTVSRGRAESIQLKVDMRLEPGFNDYAAVSEANTRRHHKQNSFVWNRTWKHLDTMWAC